MVYWDVLYSGFFEFFIYNLRIPKVEITTQIIAIGCGIVNRTIDNVHAVTGSMPTTGLPLPFISYGGNSLIASIAGMLLIRINRIPSIMSARKTLN